MNQNCEPLCCGLCRESAVRIDAPLAMAYVPMQCWRALYCPGDALRRGTIFAELDLPFAREGGVHDDL